MFSARKEQETTEWAFATHSLTPCSKQWDHKANRQLRPGGPPRQKHLSEGGRREELGRLRIGPADGSEWRGSNNNAPTLHVKELWRARSSGIISLDLHRHLAREAEGAETTNL